MAQNKIQSKTKLRGIIKSIRDSVIVINGLDTVRVNEMIEMFPNSITQFVLGMLAKTGKKGVVLNLESGIVKALAFCPDYHLQVGYCAYRTRKLIGFDIDIKLLLVVLLIHYVIF
jgi:F0F1-type ATP synthase alpha subunit